ncbi:capsular polysaccharide synthesis protein [Mannheimia massilioguelmaensis]|uniref:capsular polysaccharide synthesis protein n=1 Tax=Mannheimia massilioguelmaensis TaxID=1604354 RepID=UPI0005C939D5|nr:capsular polysaccharide synthesis protein [Mannheimia massilioguelmaensis]
MFINLISSFSNLSDFRKFAYGDLNENTVDISFPEKNIVKLSNKKNDNSLNITFFRKNNLLVAGRTYTFSCDFEITKRLNKSLPNDVPKIAFDGVDADKGTIWDIKSTIAVPNEVGIWHRSLTITIPKSFSSAWFRIHCGSESEAGYIIIKNILVTENAFDLDKDNPLLEKINDTYLIRESLNEVDLYPAIDRLCEKKNFRIVELIENRYANSAVISEKISILKTLATKQVDIAIRKFDSLIHKLTSQDESFVSHVIRKLAIHSKWDELQNYFDILEAKDLFINNAEILYQKAQTARRLKKQNKEQIYYKQALSLDTSKADIDWELFFDNYNPGLTYRREELNFLEKNLNKIQKIADSYDPEFIDITKSPIFVFWDQGLHEAPQMVQILVQQMKNVYGERLVVLSQDNLELFIDIPDTIREIRTKYRAFFSDFIRVALLMKFGGIWLDSTVLTTERFSKEIEKNLSIEENKNIYLLRVPENQYRVTSWFISTNQINNRIFVLMYAAFLTYFDTHNELFEYYQFHTFFELLTQLDKKANQDFLKSNKDNYQQYAHDLLKYLRNDFNEDVFKSIMDKSAVQKLTYKANVNHLRVNSFYKTILQKILLSQIG